MNEHLEQRLQQVAEDRKYQWPAGELAEALRLGAKAALEWLPIDTIPTDVFVDVWIKSKSNKDYGRRQVCVCKTASHSSGWVGLRLDSCEYVSHWMPIPQPQKVKP